MRAAGIATLGFVCACVSPAALANVYKCSSAGGDPIYQEAPCPPGKELRNFDADPPSLSVIPGSTGGVATKPSAHSDQPAAKGDKPAKHTASAHEDRSSGKVNGSASERRFIRRGMTDAEVRAKIGQPDITSGSAKNRNARWSYLPTDGDPDTITTINFAGNTVSDVSRKTVKK